MCWAAGFVDAVSWILLLHVYASHMTGNTAAFAIHTTDGPLGEAFRHAWPILPFIAGLIISAASSAAMRRAGFHSSFSIALGGEFLLLGLFVWLGREYGLARSGRPNSSALFYGLMCLPAAAMGLQTVTVTRVHGLRVYTTYLTGSLAKFAESVVHYAFWFRDRTRGRFKQRAPKALAASFGLNYFRNALLTAGLWVGFFLGALCGAASESRLGVTALLFPMIVILFAAGVDLVRPVSAADEAMEKDSAH